MHRMSPLMAHRDKSQSPEFTVGIDAKRTFVDKRYSAEPVANGPGSDIGGSNIPASQQSPATSRVC